jgi:hypothetical protein
VFVVPLTPAVNWRVAPVCTFALVGEMETATLELAVVTVTDADADLVESAALVAFTVKVPVVEGAV